MMFGEAVSRGLLLRIAGDLMIDLGRMNEMENGGPFKRDDGLSRLYMYPGSESQDHLKAEPPPRLQMGGRRLCVLIEIKKTWRLN